MSKPNGKTRTHFEQIPVELVEKIAIADLPDSRDVDWRLVDNEEKPPAPFQIRRATDRRKSSTFLPSPPGKES